MAFYRQPLSVLYNDTYTNWGVVFRVRDELLARAVLFYRF